MAIEEGGKVASGAIEALRSQPLALALIIVNMLFLVAGVYFLHDLKQATQARQIRQDEQFSALLQKCLIRNPEQK
jgi:hypothetical protein